MNQKPSHGQQPYAIRSPGRREFILTGLAAAATSALPGNAAAAATQNPTAAGRRLLGGKLEVSALGLGCMNHAWAYGPPSSIRSPNSAAA